MQRDSTRRTFLKKSAVLTLAAPLALSFEERALQAQQSTVAKPGQAAAKVPMPMGKIGNVQISRLICGGNLISGYAHSRDLVYLSAVLKHYFDDEKIMETWALCEQHGINTMILNPSDQRAVALYEKYRARGGHIQYLAQIVPDKNDLKTPVRRAKDVGAVGAFLQGNSGDHWAREGDVALIGEMIAAIKENGLISGVAGHEVRTFKVVEKAGFAPDFYMKTFHDNRYWSCRRPDQVKEVVDNYADNYWCMDPKETIGVMSEINRPWIAYKVLAAGAIRPRAGFQHAFENGADFAAVGMFDFQIAEDALIATEIVKATQNRERTWYA